jgi:FAD/FMN-containing dehydrogenase
VINPNLDALSKKFCGHIITPGNEAYQTVRETLFFKGSPTIVFQPADNGDVALAIAYARANTLKLSVRSGGHSVAGFSTNDGGAVIDLSLMKRVEVLDEGQGLVRIGGGAVWGNIARELHKHGLALSSGDTMSVGIGGLTLGGGIGWMVRKYGLAVDSLVALQVVTADGKTVRASDTENPDLFWALRGGGGNFGVVTAFEFKAHQVAKVYFGNIVYGLDNLPALIAGWRDGMRAAPEELTTMLVVLPSFMGMPPSAIVMSCYASDDEIAANKALKPFRNLGKVLNDDIAHTDYFETLQEAHPPQGVYSIVKNGFVQDFSDELIQTIAGCYHGNIGPVLQIRALGGAMNAVAPDATAFAHRDSEALIVSPTFVPGDASNETKTKALGDWNSIAAYTSGGYVNFFSERGEDLNVIYPEATFKRLRQVKKSYDPANTFNQNFTIT